MYFVLNAVSPALVGEFDELNLSLVNTEAEPMFTLNDSLINSVLRSLFS